MAVLFSLLALVSSVVGQNIGNANEAGMTGPGGLTINPGGAYNLSNVGTNTATNQTYMSKSNTAEDVPGNSSK